MSVSFWSLLDSCLIGNHTTSSFLYLDILCKNVKIVIQQSTLCYYLNHYKIKQILYKQTFTMTQWRNVSKKSWPTTHNTYVHWPYIPIHLVALHMYPFFSVWTVLTDLNRSLEHSILFILTCLNGLNYMMVLSIGTTSESLRKSWRFCTRGKIIRFSWSNQNDRFGLISCY